MEERQYDTDRFRMVDPCPTRNLFFCKPSHSEWSRRGPKDGPLH